jgi:hypothetical protein
MTRRERHIERLEAEFQSIVQRAREPDGTYNFRKLRWARCCRHWRNPYEKLVYLERELAYLKAEQRRFEAVQGAQGGEVRHGNESL